MSSKKNIHVTHDSGGTWRVIREGASRASSVHRTQTDAISRGRPLAQHERGELFIHDRQNRIRDRDSYGNDPCPPRDTKH